MRSDVISRPGKQKALSRARCRLTNALRLLVCISSGWAALTAAAQATTIEGSVRFAGTLPAPKTLPITSDQYVCGTSKEAQDLVISTDRGISNAVVRLQTPPPEKWRMFGPEPQIDQKECAFIPRIVIVPVGGTVEFLNSDRLLHNIRSKNVKRNRAFNRTQPRARTIPITFTKPEFIKIGCDLHPWMRSWVVVAEHPFYAVTEADGGFKLPNVSPGRYTLEVWHEVLGTMTKEIVVEESGVTNVAIEISSP